MFYMFERSTQSTKVYNLLEIPKSQRTMEISNKWATWLFIAGIVGARIAMGLFFNVTGPTLPTLSKNVDVPGKGQTTFIQTMYLNCQFFRRNLSEKDLSCLIFGQLWYLSEEISKILGVKLRLQFNDLTG